MLTITLEQKTSQTAKPKTKSIQKKAVSEPVKHLESKIKKYLGQLVTQKGLRVKVFSTTNSKVNLVIFPLLPDEDLKAGPLEMKTPKLRGDYFEVETTELSAEVRVRLGY